MSDQSEPQPKPGDKFVFEGKTYVFPSGKLGVPFEVGKAARVYEIFGSNKTLHALKVFFPQYRSHANAGHANSLSKYKGLGGLAVAERYAITSKDQQIIRAFPQFENAILMPWISGESWQNYIIDKVAITAEQSLILAREIANVVSGLESKGLAHCDLSNGNFVFSPDFSRVELVDIEEMYSIDFTAPNPPPVGTDGYAPLLAVQKGYYGPDADKHALGILITEILCWQFPKIREERESSSLFASDEFGHKSKRYKLVKQYLSELQSNDGLNPKRLSDLFDRVWFSRWKDPVQKVEQPSLKNIYDECPSAFEWKDALGTETINIIEKAPALRTSIVELDFGFINPASKIAPNLSVTISNVGGGSLSGNIISQPWLIVSPSDKVSHRKGQKNSSISVSLGQGFPRPSDGGEYKHPSGLVIQTNGGTKVIGVRFVLPKPPFYKKWLSWLSIIVIGLCCFVGLSGMGGVALFSPIFMPVRMTDTPTRIPTKVPTSTPTKKPTPYYALTSTKRAKATSEALITCSRGKVISDYRQVRICDQFNNNYLSWWIGTDSTVDWGDQEALLSNGKLRWAWNSNQGMMTYETKGSIEKDFEISVTVRRIKGNESFACYGIVFRETTSGYYWFKVCDSKTFSLWFSNPASGWENIIEDTNADSIQLGTPNKLTVVGKGQNFSFYINNEFLLEINDTRLGSGYMGIGIETQQDDDNVFEFDDFLLIVP